MHHHNDLANARAFLGSLAAALTDTKASMTVKLSEYSSSARQKSYVNVGPSEQGGPSLQRALCYAAHFQVS